MTDNPPDHLSVDPASPHHDPAEQALEFADALLELAHPGSPDDRVVRAHSLAATLDHAVLPAEQQARR